MLCFAGAGLGGLHAGPSARQVGFSLAVLEGRDRVGAKVWGVPLASGHGVDRHNSLQKRMGPYVQEFGLEVVKQKSEGQAVMPTENSERNRIQIRELLQM